MIVSMGLALIFLAAPIILIAWSRSATMFSGKAIQHCDGPRP